MFELLLAAAIAAKPFVVDTESARLDFRYAFPAEVNAIPALAGKLRADMRANRAEAVTDARNAAAAAPKLKMPFNKHSFAKDWQLAGQSARLLTLSGGMSLYLGGAHGSFSYVAMLWDRARNREVDVSGLFTPGAFDRLTRANLCRALDAERRERRGGEEPIEGSFSECPPRADFAVVPVDANRNGRFEAIDFLAGSYVAGPYAEGTYEIRLPVDGRLLKALKPEYRTSFERQRQ